MIVEHWQKSENSSSTKQEIARCSGCKENQGKDENSYIVYKRFKSEKQALNKRLVKKSESRILCEIDLINIETKTVKDPRKLNTENQQVERVLISCQESEILNEWILNTKIRKKLEELREKL